ncbi:SRPBCC family protein [Nocardioides fonticola]|uniref:SRPBCC family protein n=1 Tax=Nocardioides fonticola TaxID=450363 RepID=A0ABP7XQ70_9ACTN
MSLLRAPYGEVSLTIAAPIEEVWSLVSDVTRIGEFSPETFEAEWTHGATGPAVGARFRGHVKRNGVGPIYWVPCQINVCEPQQHLEFSVGGKNAVNNWGYRLEEVPDGVRVTEYFRLSTALPLRLYWLLLGTLRGRTNERGMRTTLERMKQVAER